jgi:hypothetical protein
MELVGEKASGEKVVLREGDIITIDGSTGRIYFGSIPTAIAGTIYSTLLSSGGDLSLPLAKDATPTIRLCCGGQININDCKCL